MIIDILSTIIYTSFQWFALLLAIIMFKKYKNTSEHVFLYFMIVVVLVELIAIVLRSLSLDSYFVFNTYTFISMIIYHYWFYRIVVEFKKLIVASAITFIIVFLNDLIKIGFNEITLVTSVIFGSISVFLFTVLYFSQLLKQEEEIKIYSSQRFWISTGLFIFNLGIAPVLYFQESLDTLGNAYGIIITLLNIILYGSFIIGFLCLYKK